jgi:hypothetical protein
LPASDQTQIAFGRIALEQRERLMQEPNKNNSEIRPSGPLTAPVMSGLNHNQSSGHIFLELADCGLVIKSQGRLDVEALFTSLPLALSAARECHELRLDLSQTLGLDNLAISVIVVLLRNYASGFGRIVLLGLPAWARRRLRGTSARVLFGRGWRCGLEADEVRYQRC